jgi:hypothetical protein
MAVDPSFIIIAILGSILVTGAASSTIIVPVFANDLTPEDLLSLQDPLQAKVTICHIPNGNPSNAHEITVGESAVPAHLAHGDNVGPCGTEPPPPGFTAKVTVTKLIRSSAGINQPEQFTICVSTNDGTTTTPAIPPCAPGSGTGFTYMVIPGMIVISETQPPGDPYHVEITCSPTEVTAGQTAICTVRNIR